jgi:methionine-gamma-lyase
MIDYSDFDFATLAIRAGWWNADPATGAVSPPISQTSTYALKKVEDVTEILTSGNFSRFIYTRGSHPNEIVLEERMAALEGGERALAFATGVAAITGLITFLVKSGDHIVTGKSLYAATQFFFRNILAKFGVTTTFVDATDMKAVAAAITPATRIIYVETPANPTMSIVDLKALGALAGGRNITTIVDSTFASPYLLRPLEFEGIDVVLHSATKYIGGHTDALGGIIVGKKDLIDQVRMYSLVNLGGIIDPFAAWLLLRGLKTIHVRLDRHCQNAMEVARFLEAHPKVGRVFYPGLPSHPQHALAKSQMKGFGGMLAFELKGGLEAGRTLLNNLHLIRLAASLGDVDTLIEHPASMTHNDMFVTREERLFQGITDGLVRLSVGLEGVKDIIADLEQGLKLV